MSQWSLQIRAALFTALASRYSLISFECCCLRVESLLMQLCLQCFISLCPHAKQLHLPRNTGICNFLSPTSFHVISALFIISVALFISEYLIFNAIISSLKSHDKYNNIKLNVGLFIVWPFFYPFYIYSFHLATVTFTSSLSSSSQSVAGKDV